MDDLEDDSSDEAKNIDLDPESQSRAKSSTTGKLSPIVRQASNRSRRRKQNQKVSKSKLGKGTKNSSSSSKPHKGPRSNRAARKSKSSRDDTHKKRGTGRAAGSNRSTKSTSRKSNKSGKTSRKRVPGKTRPKSTAGKNGLSKTKSSRTKGPRKSKSRVTTMDGTAGEEQVTEEPIIVLGKEESGDQQPESGRIDWNARSMGMDGDRPPSDNELEKLRKNEEEEDQGEEEEEDNAPPSKVVVGWGGDAALEKAPINLRKQFTNIVKDEQPTPRSSHRSPTNAETAQTKAKVVAPKPAKQREERSAPKLDRAAQRAKRRKARLEKRGEKSYTKRQHKAVAKEDPCRRSSKQEKHEEGFTSLSIDTSTPDRKKNNTYRAVGYGGTSHSRRSSDSDDSRRDDRRRNYHSDDSDSDYDRRRRKNDSYKDRGRREYDSYSSDDEPAGGDNKRWNRDDSFDSTDSDYVSGAKNTNKDHGTGNLSDSSELSPSDIGRNILRNTLEEDNTTHGHARLAKRPPSQRIARRKLAIPVDRVEKRQFLCNPIPRGFGTMQCKITRTPDKVMYLLQLEDCTGLPGKQNKDMFLLNGKKRRHKTQFNFIISDDEYEMSRTGPGCMAKLRANAATTEYTLFDEGTNPKFRWKNSGASGAKNELRKQLMCIKITKATFGISRGPREMMVICPLVTGDKSAICRPMTESPSESLASWTHTKLTRLQNKKPQWNAMHRKYILNFHGRVSEASVKNFQLELISADDDGVAFQCGRTGKNTFIVDFSYPLSPVQAFAIAVCSLTT